MSNYNWNNLDRALAYGCAELGEKFILNEGAQTISTVLARDGKTSVLAPGTTKAQATTHVATIHPAIGKVTG